jgi:hypothetical protein
MSTAESCRMFFVSCFAMNPEPTERNGFRLALVSR